MEWDPKSLAMRMRKVKYRVNCNTRNYLCEWQDQVWSISCDMAIRKVLGPYWGPKSKKNPMYIFEKEREYKRNWHVLLFSRTVVGYISIKVKICGHTLKLGYFKISPELNLTPFWTLYLSTYEGTKKEK